jgi:hypothetical protein
MKQIKYARRFSPLGGKSYESLNYLWRHHVLVESCGFSNLEDLRKKNRKIILILSYMWQLPFLKSGVTLRIRQPSGDTLRLMRPSVANLHAGQVF